MLVATPPGCTTLSRTGLAAICSSWRSASENHAPRISPPHRRSARRRDDAEDAGEVDDVGLAPAREMRQERARAMHLAPEVDVHQPVHLRLVDFVELAEQRNAGIVDDDVEAGVRGDCSLRKIFDLAGSDTSTR
jgi:hypothetical protein